MDLVSFSPILLPWRVELKLKIKELTPSYKNNSHLIVKKTKNLVKWDVIFYFFTFINFLGNGGYPTRAPKFYETIGHVKMANYPVTYQAKK